jgi:hypothetical protein
MPRVSYVLILIRALYIASLVGLSVACVERAPAVDYGDPTSLHVPTRQSGIHAYIVSPRAFEPLETASPELIVAAWLDEAPEAAMLASVALSDGLVIPLVDGGAGVGAQRRLSAPVVLRHGLNPLQIVLEDAARTRRRVISYTLPHRQRAPIAAPSALASADERGQCPQAPVAVATRRWLSAPGARCVYGSVSTASGEVEGARVEVSVEGAAAVEAAVDEAGRFVAPVVLPSGAPSASLVLTATHGGERGRSETRVSLDEQAPRVELKVPGESSAEVVQLEVVVEDESGVAAIWARLPGQPRVELPVQRQLQLTARLEPGDNFIQIEAEDVAGNRAMASASVRRVREIVLRPPRAGAGSAELELDREALGALLTEQDQRAIELVRLDMTPAIASALRAIREPERFGQDTSTWGQAERNLNRLLTMTPDTADVRGTALEPLLQISAAVGLPVPRILADSLELGVIDPFVDPDVLVEVIVAQLLATHPAFVSDTSGAPALPITLYDVLQDLAPVGARLGPAPPHPGVLGGPIRATVLEPGFRMNLRARSNLMQLEGVHAARLAKDFLFISRGDGPTLELDFLSPETFSIVGISDEPRADLVIQIAEHDGFIGAGSSRSANPDPQRANFARGDSAAWSLPRWELESITAEALYRQYHARFASQGFMRERRWDAGDIMDAARILWGRGWLTITTIAGVGAPPAPLYVWDMLLEVAQIRLHDGGIPEGQANVRFTLRDIALGIDAATIIEASRPTLQAQREELSSRLVGAGGGLVPSSVDLFFMPSSSPSPELPGFLFFRAPQDEPEQPYPWRAPGFFADAALTQRLSTTGSLPGADDTIHEKIAARAGVTAYFEDRAGDVYELKIVRVGAEGVALTVERAEASR